MMDIPKYVGIYVRKKISPTRHVSKRQTNESDK